MTQSTKQWYHIITFVKIWGSEPHDSTHIAVGVKSSADVILCNKPSIAHNVQMHILCDRSI